MVPDWPNVVDTEGHDRRAEHRAEPGHGVRRGVVHGDDRRRPVGRRDQRGEVEPSPVGRASAARVGDQVPRASAGTAGRAT